MPPEIFQATHTHTHTQISFKIGPVVPEIYTWTDRQTDVLITINCSPTGDKLINHSVKLYYLHSASTEICRLRGQFSLRRLFL